MTTRMPPVREGAEQGSAVRPVGSAEAEVSTPIDRRVTAPSLPRMDIEALTNAARSGDPAALARAQLLFRAAIAAAPPVSVAHVLQAPRPGHKAVVPTQDANYSVIDAPMAIDEYDHFPELPSHHVTEVSSVDLEREARAAAYQSGTNRVPPPVPEYVVAQPVRRPQPSAASPRPPAQERPRSPTPSGSQPPPHPDRGNERHDELTQARMQLAHAVETARKSEQRARDAELLAAWAERYVPQPHVSEQQLRARREQRIRWFKRALQVCFVGLAIGAYFSLLGPVRQRVVTQNATIQRLTELQEQLRSEQRELRERIEQEHSAREEEPPAQQKPVRGKALAPR